MLKEYFAGKKTDTYCFTYGDDALTVFKVLDKNNVQIDEITLSTGMKFCPKNDNYQRYFSFNIRKFQISKSDRFEFLANMIGTVLIGY